MGLENPVHLLFIALVALLVLGPKRLPELARALGHGIREFREAIGQQSEPRIEPQALQEPFQPPIVEQQAQPPAAVQPAAPEPAQAPVGELQPVDPGEPIRSGDAPDRRPL